MKKKLITLLIVSMGFVFTQEFDVDGDLKVSGDIIFEDETTQNTAAVRYRSFEVMCQGGGSVANCVSTNNLIDCGAEGAFVQATMAANPGGYQTSSVYAYGEQNGSMINLAGESVFGGVSGTYTTTSISVPCVPNSSVKINYSGVQLADPWTRIVKWSY